MVGITKKRSCITNSQGRGRQGLMDLDPYSTSASSADDASPERTKRRRRRTPSSGNARKNEGNEILEMIKLLKVEFHKQSKQNKDDISEIHKQLEKVLENQNVQSKELKKLRKQSELHTNGTSHASDAPRSQSNQLQPPRYRLVFTSGNIDTIEKGQTIDISVALVEGNNDQTVENGPLASATVELVVVNAEFNEHDNQHNWSREEFEYYMKKPRRGNTATGDVDQSVKSIVSNGRFNLVHGAKCHSGSRIFENSSNKKVRFGVMVVSPTEERVLEGLSNPFFVRGHDRPGRQNNLRHNSSNRQRHAMVGNENQEENSPMPNLQHPCRINSTQTEGNSLDMIGGRSQLPITTTEPSISLQALIQPYLDPAMTRMPQAICRQNGQAMVGNENQEENSPMPNLQHPCRINSTQTEGNSLDMIGGRSQLPITTIEPSTSLQALVQPYLDPAMTRMPQAICRQSGQAMLGNENQEQNSPMPNLPHLFWINSTQTAGNSLGMIGGRSQFPFPATESSINALITSYPYPDSLWVDQAFPGQNDTRFTTNPTTLAVQLVWDRPNVEPSKRHWNLLDQLMPLPKFNKPTTRLMQEHLDPLTIIAMEVMQTRRNRGVIIEPLEPDDSDEERQLKRKMCSKYELRFLNKVCGAYHTRDPIKADDGNLLKVALFDENNIKITYGPLSSASVQIVVLHGDFNDHGQDYWTSEEFGRYEVCPRPGEEASSVLGGNCILVLADGEACLGDVFFQMTSYCARTGKFKLGVRLASTHEERIQEGVSEPFWVKDRHFAGQALVDNNYQEQNNPMPNLPHLSPINAGNSFDLIGGRSKLPIPATESATMKQKIVIRVEMTCARRRTTAMQLVAATPGVDSVALAGDARDQLVVVGHGVDPVRLVTALRNKVGPANLLQVGAEAKKEGGGDKKTPAAAAAVPLPPYVPQPLSYERPILPPYVPQPFYGSSGRDCSIM
ncbi:uncharacterized protein LOC101785879 isoform X3 [Setaria italica]|uniref:uncharacterized protein LOC101785879 isoform X3 n=1 Tax=Setaria italica TaxID=4555 RepID=UPI0003513FA0|nr:uncharacterized protein LOC101785879 isoform X3 [Setaria italica]